MRDGRPGQDATIFSIAAQLYLFYGTGMQNQNWEMFVSGPRDLTDKANNEDKSAQIRRWPQSLSPAANELVQIPAEPNTL